MGIVDPSAHQIGRTKSATSPSTVNEAQKILRSIQTIVSLPATEAVAVTCLREKL
jgi:hypothetical protein